MEHGDSDTILLRATASTPLVVILADNCLHQELLQHILPRRQLSTPTNVFNNHHAVFVHYKPSRQSCSLFLFLLSLLFVTFFVYSDNKTAENLRYAPPTTEIFSASSSGSGSQGSWWSLSSHVRYWQHRRVPSSPTRSRVWQARQGVPPTSSAPTPAKVYLYYPNNGNIDHDYIALNSATSTSTSALRAITSTPSPVRDFGLCSSQTVRDARAVCVTTDPTAGGC